MSDDNVETPKPVVFGHSHVGTASGARSNDDRHFEGTIRTQGGLEITLLVVSDGEGAQGGQAAQRTLETVVEFCQASPLQQVNEAREMLTLLGQAIGEANRRVYNEAQAQPDPAAMAATAAVAAIVNGQLYVANVGHSRVYLVRGEHVVQLTIDHAQTGNLLRAIGRAPTVQVDLGLYFQGGREGGGQAYQQQGFVLDVNDIVLVCSDGLIRPVPGKQSYFVSSQEIREVIERSTAEQAAKTLVDLAVGRNVVDNVTAAVVEMPGRVRPRLLMPSLRVGITAAIAISAVIIVLFGVLLVVVPQFAPQPAAPTPTPIFAAIRDGRLSYLSPGEDVQTLGSGAILAFGPGAVVTLADQGATLDLPGNYRLYLAGTIDRPSQVEFFQAGQPGVDSQTVLRLKTGSLAIIAAGGADANILVIVEAGVARVSVTGFTRMGVRFEDAQFTVDCFQGACALDNGAGTTLPLVDGQRGIVDAGGNLSGPLESDPNAYPEYPVP